MLSCQWPASSCVKMKGQVWDLIAGGVIILLQVLLLRSNFFFLPGGACGYTRSSSLRSSTFICGTIASRHHMVMIEQTDRQTDSYEKKDSCKWKKAGTRTLVRGFSIREGKTK